MKKLIVLLVLSMVLVVAFSCSECDGSSGLNQFTPQCDLWRGFIPEAQSTLNNSNETEENKNLARRLLGQPTVEIQPTSVPIPQPAPSRPGPPAEIIPESPLRQVEFKVESNCSWMGCVWEFVWGD